MIGGACACRRGVYGQLAEVDSRVVQERSTHSSHAHQRCSAELTALGRGLAVQDGIVRQVTRDVEGVEDVMIVTPSSGS